MNHNLFDHVNIRKEYTYVPSGLTDDAAKECAAYDQLIEDLGGVDLQLLGIGGNGHIGFNEPADAFAKGTHQVALTEETRQANARFFASIDQVPTHAYTMGVGNIMSALDGSCFWQMEKPRHRLSTIPSSALSPPEYLLPSCSCTKM